MQKYLRNNAATLLHRDYGKGLSLAYISLLTGHATLWDPTLDTRPRATDLPYDSIKLLLLHNWHEIA